MGHAQHCHELYSHSQQLLSGAVEDESFFPLVKELPRDADWTDEALWALANPGLGDFRDMQELRQACERASWCRPSRTRSAISTATSG